MRNSIRLAFALLAVCICAALLSSVGRATSELTTPSNIRLTPPAPVFDDKDRVAELIQRRERVAKSIGPQSFLVLFSTEPRTYANDVEYPYRQENNLYYLTNLKQRNATLVLLPGNTKVHEILFMPRRNAQSETWTGHMYSPEEANQLSGIREIWHISEFDPFIKALRNRQPYRPKAENILMSDLPADMPLTNDHGYTALFDAAAKGEAGLYMLVPGGESREYRQEQRFAADWASTASGFSVKNAWPIFTEMRLAKSPMELRLLQHAIDISTEAHQRAWAMAGTAKWEYEVDAVMAYTMKLRNADNWGYPDIVGCGPNATTLHYIESQGAVKPGELLLMDVGAEYDHYTADITRTFPVNGKFSPLQAAVYQIVYDAQEAVAKASKPGATLSDANRAGAAVVRDGLYKLGLITDRDSVPQQRVWFMHGTSHWLGMNVHDVGGGHPMVVGAVFTNEPGIYIRTDALDQMPVGWKTDEWEKFKTAVRPAFEKYKGIGVRIEDDMQVTVDGARWMSEALPRNLSDIEDFIAKARRPSE